MLNRRYVLWERLEDIGVKCQQVGRAKYLSACEEGMVDRKKKRRSILKENGGRAHPQRGRVITAINADITPVVWQSP